MKTEECYAYLYDLYNPFILIFQERPIVIGGNDIFRYFYKTFLLNGMHSHGCYKTLYVFKNLSCCYEIFEYVLFILLLKEL